MPIFKAGSKLVYFAHVPKCGGTSIENYLQDRFGPIAFLDRDFSRRNAARHWSRTSPQHIDWESLERLFPRSFFDAVFAVVRHPVARVVSAYKFQQAVERSVSTEVPFAEWLHKQAQAWRRDPFVVDNHIRPQADFVPADCDIFHLEHGLDAIIPYLDRLAGVVAGPRRTSHVRPGDRSNTERSATIAIGPAELALIDEIYARDFGRFRYRRDEKMPTAPRPVPDCEFLAENAATRARDARPLNRLAARVKRRWGKWRHG